MKKMMVKKLSVLLVLTGLITTLCGCWNYRGLNEISIVIGMAIDQVAGSDKYQLTYEIIDYIKSSKETGVKTRLVESEGNSVFEAIRDAKRRLGSKLYFSNMEILVISNQVAANRGINDPVDFFMRDAEPRETLNIIISQEKTAKDLLKAEGVNSSIISSDIKQNLEEDNKYVIKTTNIPLYKIYSYLKGEGTELALPLFHRTFDNGKSIAESNGVAVFKKGKLVGYLSPEETRYYLFIKDEVKGGVLNINLNNKTTDFTTLEIAKSKTKLSFTNNDNLIKFIIKPQVNVHIGEFNNNYFLTELQDINKIESLGESYLAERILNVIEKVRTKYNSDIFGFGSAIYRKNPKLWFQIKDKEYLHTIKVEVIPEITIENTGYIEK